MFYSDQETEAYNQENLNGSEAKKCRSKFINFLLLKSLNIMCLDALKSK